jgi:lipopolysaccharide transport system permease protein
MSGTIIWTYFADCLNKTSDTFLKNTHLFGKVYFPRLAVPISILFSNLITFTIQFVFFLAFMGFFALRGSNIKPNIWIALTPVLIMLLAGLGLGSGILISSLTTKYRDLRFLVQFGTQLFMYATPIIYPVSSISESYRFLIRANPLTSIVEAFRYAFLGTGDFNLWQLAYSFVFMIILLILSSLIFNRVEQTFMDTV